ncbi:MAG: hypothetical protein OES47_01325, partial [Acidobacteriota bacterium]|nr:hypothetical protein [Acidobacteriota bacterium]
MSRRTQKGYAAVLCVWLVALFLIASPPVISDVDQNLDRSARAAQLMDEEVLSYGWSLGGFKGMLARLVVPGRGGATLRTGRNGTGHLVSELNIFSPRSRHGDFQRYGAEIGSGPAAETLKAWTTQMFRGRKKEKEEDLGGEEAVDIASSIWRLRREPAFGSGRSRLWSGGNFYPIEVRPAGKSWATLEGHRITTRSFLIQGVRKEG